MKKILCTVSVLSLAGWLSGCTTYTTRVNNTPPTRPSRYVPMDTPIPGGATGIESQDIVGMTDRMVRDMLANPILVRTPPSVVIVDSTYFRNESSQRINRDMIVDRLRVSLLRAANGRIRFIGRHASNMLENEKELRSQGVVGGTPTRQAEAQFRLVGSFQNLPADLGGGKRTNYVQVVFEMIDLSTGEVVWANMYEFKKINEESVMYQ